MKLENVLTVELLDGVITIKNNTNNEIKLTEESLRKLFKHIESKNSESEYLNQNIIDDLEEMTRVLYDGSIYCERFIEDNNKIIDTLKKKFGLIKLGVRDDLPRE